MKLFRKIMTFITAASMILSLSAFSVSAAGRTLTISVTDAEGGEITSLNVGEEVIVSVTMDSNAGISAVGYKLNFDGDNLAYDETLQGSGASANKCPKWMDLTWWNDTRLGNNMVGGYFGKPTYSLNNGNQIGIGFAGADAIAAADNVENELIGKFHFTAKNAIGADNKITFTITEATTLEAEGDTPCNVSPITVPAVTPIDYAALDAAIVAFGTKTETDYTAESWAAAKTAYDAAVAAKTATTQAEVDAATTALNNAIAALVEKPVDKVTVTPDERKEKKDNESGLWTYGFSGTITKTGNGSFTKIVFNLKDNANGKTGKYEWPISTSLSAPVTYGLNIKGCPVDSDVTATVTAE